METLYICYQLEDDDTLTCVGTFNTRTKVDDFAYAMSRKYDFDYQVYVQTFNPDHGLHKEIFLYSMYNGKVRW